MINYKCPSCGKLFDPEKNDICPRCGCAVAPSVMTRIERKRTAERLRAEGKFNYDEHCHEDDAWKQSYGASMHRAAVRNHEDNLRAVYHAHKAADDPTRPANSVPARFSGSNPTRVSNANPTRVSNANPAQSQSGSQQNGARNKEPLKALRWFIILWIIYVLYRTIAG